MNEGNDISCGVSGWVFLGFFPSGDLSMCALGHFGFLPLETGEDCSLCNSTTLVFLT